VQFDVRRSDRFRCHRPDPSDEEARELRALHRLDHRRDRHCTWVFNNTAGSVPVAILLHASMDAFPNAILRAHFPEATSKSSVGILNGYFALIIGFGGFTLLPILVARGRLGLRGRWPRHVEAKGSGRRPTRTAWPAWRSRHSMTRRNSVIANPVLPMAIRRGMGAHVILLTALLFIFHGIDVCIIAFHELSSLFTDSSRSISIFRRTHHFS
jgi:hypothetical protein